MIDTQQLLANVNIVDVIGKHISLKKQGPEHVGVCPFHDDEKASLSVNETKQIFKCFACGGPDGKGGDALHFIMGLGRTFHEACDELSGGDSKYETTAEKRTPKVIKEPEWKHVYPVDDLPSDIRHSKFGPPSNHWEYLDANGKIIGSVCRFDLDDGSKQVLPFCFATNGTVSNWRWMGFNKPRALYNLDMIHAHPKSAIIVVEGEKTADAVQKELDPNKTICTTWIGGANGIVNADFSILNGRKIMFWPDHDTEQKYGQNHPLKGQIKPWFEQPGNQAMLNINDLIEKHCKIRRWINVPDEFPHKWDAADKEWNEGELRQFVKTNMVDVPEIPEVEEEQPEVVEKTPIPHDQIAPPKSDEPFKDRFSTDNPHYKMLGYDKDENGGLAYYFFSFDAKTTIKLKPPSMSKSNLMMIAPINYWEDLFSGNGKINIDAAQQYLINHSHRVGMFKEKFIRGRGAWVDQERIVIHTGDELIVDEEHVKLRDIDSRYVYEIGEKMGLGANSRLSTVQSSKLIEKMNWLVWERDINAYLIAGWCVIAPFCGVLNWRPHVWVTGPAGSGKSWVMENMVRKLLGEAAVVVQGKTTEAGVRGLLQNDARAVLFDESDVDSHNDRERIQNILALARSSSSHDGGVIGKGTQSGASRTYIMRSCFAFSSIGVQLNQQSDRSRFTMLGLMSFEKHKTKEDFEKFERGFMELITDDYVQELQARTIRLLPVILKNSRTFADAVTHVVGQRRTGDQVGAMLAGAYSLTSTKEISFADAIDWVKTKNWDEEKSLELTKDEYQLFSKIMGHPIKIESQYGIIERTVGETILISCKETIEFNLSAEAASSRLRRLGIIVNDKEMFFSNTADGIKIIIKNTSWANNHNKILERLPDARKVEPRVYYPGCNSRGVSLPLTMILEDKEAFGSTPIAFSPTPTAKNDEGDDLPF